jgi:CHAT domain-containing protein
MASALLIARFYELHIDKGLRPAAALHEAQAWLRQATNADLTAYVQAAADAGRMARNHADAARAAMSVEGLKRGGNSAAVEWIEPQGSNEAAKEAPPQPLARPFAHPYFWAGFVYTGQ